MINSALQSLRPAPHPPRGPNMSGMPGSGGAGSSVESAALEIVELKASIEAKLIRCSTERARLIGYIDAVPDSRMREIMYLRFVDGLPWAQVGASMGYTGDGVRKACKHYIDAGAA